MLQGRLFEAGRLYGMNYRERLKQYTADIAQYTVPIGVCNIM